MSLLKLDGSDIDFVSEWKYLGTTVKNFHCSASHSYSSCFAKIDLQKLYQSSNCKLNASLNLDKLGVLMSLATEVQAKD